MTVAPVTDDLPPLPHELEAGTEPEIVDAETIEDDTPADGITDPQLKKLLVLFDNAQIAARVDRLADPKERSWVDRVGGHAVASAADPTSSSRSSAPACPVPAAGQRRRNTAPGRRCSRSATPPWASMQARTR